MFRDEMKDDIDDENIIDRPQNLSNLNIPNIDVTMWNDDDVDSNSEDSYNYDERKKEREVNESILKSDFNIEELKTFGYQQYGFVNDETRRSAWPRLLGLSEESLSIKNIENINNLISKEVYQQISVDVARSSGHLEENCSEEQVQKFKKDLTQIICWVLTENPRLHYYQGYNDVAATVLLVMGLEKSPRILEKISLEFLQRFIEETMDSVNQELFFILALLHREHPKLLEHLEK